MYTMLIGAYAIFSIGVWSITQQRLISVLLIGLYVVVSLLFAFWFVGFVPYIIGVILGVPLVYGGLTILVFYNRMSLGG